MSAEPPLLDGAVHDTTDWLLARDVAETPVGAPGGPAGVTELDADELGPEPAPLVATTRNV